MASKTKAKTGGADLGAILKQRVDEAMAEAAELAKDAGAAELADVQAQGAELLALGKDRLAGKLSDDDFHEALKSHEEARKSRLERIADVQARQWLKYLLKQTAEFVKAFAGGIVPAFNRS